MDPHLGTNYVWPNPLRMAQPVGAVAVADMCIAYMAVQLTHGQTGHQYNANVWHDKQSPVETIKGLGGCWAGILIRGLNY